MLGFEIHPFIRILFWVLVFLFICYLVGASPAGIIQGIVHGAQNAHNAMMAKRGH